MGDSPENADFAGYVSRLEEQAKEMQDSAASLISRTTLEEDALRQRLASLDSHINSLRNSKHTDEKLQEELIKVRYILSEGDAAAFLPNKSQGKFLRMFLGPINVRANRKDLKLKMKEEYYNVRDRTAYLFLFFPSLLLVLSSWIWDGCLPALPVQLYQAWLLYLYTGLALRENILRVNGSDIRPWWIKHHYYAMGMALISLTWEIEKGPDCSQKQRGVQLYLIWAIFQGVAMILQNIYQRQRLYTRITMGKANRMDVVWGRNSWSRWSVIVVVPCTLHLAGIPVAQLLGFFRRGFEACVGVLLLKTAVTQFVFEWQVIACGILLIIMAVGNFSNTVQTLVKKSRVKAKMKKGKSRQELNQDSDGKIL